MCPSVNGSIEKQGHILGHIVHILQRILLDKSLHMWLVWTLPLNNVASNFLRRMWSDLSSDLRPSVKALLHVKSEIGIISFPYRLSEGNRRWKLLAAAIYGRCYSYVIVISILEKQQAMHTDKGPNWQQPASLVTMVTCSVYVYE